MESHLRPADTEEALRASEERFRVAQELSLDAFAILDAVRDAAGTVVGFRVRYVNPAGTRILGRSREELEGALLQDVLPGTEADREVFDRYVRVVETGEPHDIEVRYASNELDGWFRNMAVKLGDAVAVSFSDITARKRTEAAFRESEAHLRHVVELNPQVPWTADPDGAVEGFSQRWLDLTGLTREQALGGGWVRAAHPDDLPAMTEAWSKAVATGDPYDIEHRIRLADGNHRWMRTRAFPRRDAEGRIVRWYGTTEDIHERRTVELALRASDERFRLATEAIHAIIYDIDRVHGRAVRTRGLREVLGYDPAEVPDDADWWLEQMQADDRVRVLAEMAQLDASPAREFRAEYRVRHKDGRWIHIEDRSIVQRDDSGRVVRQVGCSQDVTQVREAEAALRERAEELAALMEASPAVTFIAHDPEALVITGNRAGREILRMSDGGNLSKTAPGPGAPAHFTVWHDGREVAPEDLPVQRAARGIEVRGYEEELRFADGDIVFLFGSAVPLRDEDGRSRGAVGAFVDVTPLKQAERALKDADRRKDEFLAMLAHELRNPLAPIRNAVEVLKRMGSSEPQLVQMRDTIHRQVTHLAQLVDDLLDVSRITQDKITLRKEPLELMTLVGRAVETSRPLIDARRHHLTVSVTSEPVRVEGDLTRLAQVLSNLLNNAAKFTEEGGHLLLDVSRIDGEVLLRVRDDGMGIAREVLPHVFDLFAQADRSLDRSQGGLGIGLTLVRRLVEMHGGRVEASSDGPGTGSEFRVFLPVLADEPRVERLPSHERPAGGPGGGSRVLVVDDSVDAAESMALLLDFAGHETAMAHNGQAALEAAAAFHPDVVLLDIGLPGMDGYEVARRMRESPGLRSTFIIALTGYGRPEDRVRALASGCHYHMTKPVDLDEIEALIRTLRRD